MRILILLVLILLPFHQTAGAAAASVGSARDIARRALRDIAEALDQIPRADQGDPAFLMSYHFASDDPSAFARTHGQVAYAYDNALAVLALIASGDKTRARRIADAFLIALSQDRYFKDGRMRNAYRAGAVDRHSSVLLPGWWDQAAARWFEDGYQVGQATGSAAFVGLALDAVGRATGDARYQDGAVRIASWIGALGGTGADGFSGGYLSHEPKPNKVTWKSVEHNVDAAALFRALGSQAPKGAFERAASFTRRMVDPGSGRLFVGTLPDGVTQNRDLTSVDAMTLAVAAGLLSDPDAQKALAAVERLHGIRQGASIIGVSFSGSRDTLWIEGTAQWAVALAAQGRQAEAENIIQGLATDRDPGGYWRAIRGQKMETGLSTGIDPTKADFLYSPVPHLAATAWVALAGMGANPLGPQSP
jgi:hypothetical protein